MIFKENKKVKKKIFPNHPKNSFRTQKIVPPTKNSPKKHLEIIFFGIFFFFFKNHFSAISSFVNGSTLLKLGIWVAWGMPNRGDNIAILSSIRCGYMRWRAIDSARVLVIIYSCKKSMFSNPVGVTGALFFRPETDLPFSVKYCK